MKGNDVAMKKITEIKELELLNLIEAYGQGAMTEEEALLGLRQTLLNKEVEDNGLETQAVELLGKINKQVYGEEVIRYWGHELVDSRALKDEEEKNKLYNRLMPGEEKKEGFFYSDCPGKSFYHNITSLEILKITNTTLNRLYSQIKEPMHLDYFINERLKRLNGQEYRQSIVVPKSLIPSLKEFIGEVIEEMVLEDEYRQGERIPCLKNFLEEPKNFCPNCWIGLGSTESIYFLNFLKREIERGNLVETKDFKYYRSVAYLFR